MMNDEQSKQSQLGLPKEAAELWQETYADGLKTKSDASFPQVSANSATLAWTVVRANYEQVDGVWQQRAFFSSDYDASYCERRDFSDEKREELADKGMALDSGGFPVENCEDVKNAVQAIGRASDREKTIDHIIRSARRLGCMDNVPQGWLSKDTPRKVSERSAPIVLRGLSEQDEVDLLREGYGSTLALRPDELTSAEWNKLPIAQRTVSAVIFKRNEARSYARAVERTIAEGWSALPNTSRPEEMIFKRWTNTPEGPLMIRGFLVRSHGSLDWKMLEVSRGASSSLAIRTSPDAIRFRGPFKAS